MLAPLLLLDDYLDAQRIGFAHVVSIDTEGHDALVLRGLARALSAARVGVIEFEVGPNWGEVAHGSQRLLDVLAWLDQLGYGCFVATKSGCIVPTRIPDATSPPFDRSPPSGNVVCGAPGAYVNALAQFAKRCACCMAEQLWLCEGAPLTDSRCKAQARAP